MKEEHVNIRKITDVLTLLTILVGLVGTILIVVPKMARLMAFPYEYGYGESIILDRVSRLSSCQRIYPPLSEMPPFCISYYTPIFHLVQLPFYWMFGPAYWFGRLISTVSLGVVVVVMYLIIKELTGNKRASILAAVFFVLSPPVIYWVGLSRPDFLAMAFSLGALLNLIRSPNSKNALLISMLLFLAAFYTKQTYFIVGILTAFAWLARQSGFIRGFIFLFLVSTTCTALFIFLNWATSGGLYIHTVLANVNQYSLSNLYNSVRRFLEFSPVLFLSAGIFLCYGLYRRTRQWIFGATYLAGSSVVSLTIGNVGGDWNHFLELSVGLSMAAGIVASEIHLPSALKVSVKTMLLIQIGYSCLICYKNFAIPQYLSLYSNFRGWEEVRHEIRKAKSPIMTDSGMGFLPLERREIFFEPYGMTQLSLSGVWDESPVIRLISERAFSIAVIRMGGTQEVRFSKQMMETLSENYVEAKRIKTGRIIHSIYYPKQK